MSTKEINELILANPEFQKLKNIGGCRDYHNEGDSLVHTMLVYEEAKKVFGEDHWMTTVALLHDIGKIYTGWEDDNGDWHYPNHSTVGGQDEILSKFIDKDDEMYETYKWYVSNHIKPLFWRFKGIKVSEPTTNLCSMDFLRKLAICDVRGSYSLEPQDELISYLENLEL